MKLRFYFLVLLSCFFIQDVMGQAKKEVYGTVLDDANKSEPVSPDVETRVLIFNTKAAAEDAYDKIVGATDPQIFLSPDDEVRPDINGKYTAVVAENGALIVIPGMIGSCEPVLEYVNGRREITTYVQVGIMLDAVFIDGETTIIEPTQIAGEQFGNVNELPGLNIPLPANLSKSNSRLVIAPYVVNHSKRDTTYFRIPHVYEGTEFSRTQSRWIGFDAKHDSLSEYVSKTEFIKPGERNVFVWNDTLVFPNSKDNFQLLADVTLEDYLGVYYTKHAELSTRYTRRPLQLLEYELNEYSLDPMKYKEEPTPQKRSEAVDVSLTFVLGEAKLDPDNPENEIELQALTDRLLNIVNEASTTLKEVYFTSAASPDGVYANNQILAKKRLNHAMELILSKLPRYNRDRLYSHADSRVASWTEVAKAMEDSSYMAEAGEVRAIIEKYKSQDLQSAKIKQLPCYDLIREKFLPLFRNITCTYMAETYRALSPNEILELYNDSVDYRTGKKQFQLYEYWHLFNLVKDSMELEKLYRQAYDYSKTIVTAGKPKGKPWALAANNLVVSYLKRDTLDLSILEPLVDRSVRNCNVRRTMGGILTDVINIEEIVANQLIMYIKAEQYENADVMGQILPKTEKYGLFKSLTTCLRGGYRYNRLADPNERAVAREAFEAVKNSSPINNVVMCLAMSTLRYTKEAQRLLEDETVFPTGDPNPKVYYLKAITYSRLGDAFFMQAMQSLQLALQLGGEEYENIARTDGDLPEDLKEMCGISEND